MPDLVIKNARLMLPGGLRDGGLVIEDGKITDITVDARLPRSRYMINAGGNIILPGLIDCHVHLRDPGQTHKEDWRTGSAAAAAGGVTTVLDMPNNRPPVTTVSRFLEKKKLAASKSRVDFGLHFAASADDVSELQNLKDAASIKFYVGPTTGDVSAGDDIQVKEELDAAAKKNILASVHAEDWGTIERLTKKLAEKLHPSALDYAESRPNAAAALAVEKMLSLRKESGARMHICHVSTREELGILSEHKCPELSAEATPHHLFLSKKDIKALGNFSKVNPPLRTEADRVALWDAVRSGLIDLIATDHAPHLREEKSEDILSAPAGMPGLETMLPLLLNEVCRRNLALEDVVRLTSENPAKVFSIRRKGRIAEGYDADLVIVDLKSEKKVDDDRLFTKCGWSPFSGRVLRGWPTVTLVRGAVVYDNGVVEKNAGKEVSYEKK